MLSFAGSWALPSSRYFFFISETILSTAFGSILNCYSCCSFFCFFDSSIFFLMSSKFIFFPACWFFLVNKIEAHLCHLVHCVCFAVHHFFEEFFPFLYLFFNKVDCFPGKACKGFNVL